MTAGIGGWARTAGFAGAYALATYLGRVSRLEGSEFSLVWPAAPVAVLWLLLAVGRRERNRSLAAMVVVTFAMNLLTGAPTAISVGFVGVNVALALITTWCLTRFSAVPRLESPTDLGRLLAASFAGSLAAAVLAATAFSWFLGASWPVMFVVFLTRNGMSVFAGVAVVLALRELRPGRLSAARIGEGLLTGAVGAATVALVFTGDHELPLTFLLFPVGVWVALRFHTAVAAGFTVVTGVAILVLTMAGQGVFGEGPILVRVLLAQMLLGVMMMVVLALALYRDARVRLVARLDETTAQLRTKAELLEAVLDTIADGVVVVGRRGERTLTNAAAAASPVLPRVLDTRSALGEVEHPLLVARGGRPAATRSARVEVGGEHREIALAARPLPGHGGRGTAVAVFRDVTEERTAQRRLRETRDLFAGVLDAATEQSIISTDADGFITVFNVGAQRMLGYTAEEMIGRQPTMIHDPEEVRARAEELGLPYGFEVFVHAARSGATETREWTYLRQDASRLDVLLTVSAMTGPDGEVVGFIGIAHDITQRRRAERALAASEEKFRLAFETAPVGMYIFGVGAEDHGRILRVNEEMSRFVGRTPEVLRGCRVQQLADTGDERSVDALLDQLALTPGDHQRVEIAFRRPDGHVVWGSVSATVVAPEGGAPYGICLIEDVTARRQVEAELRHLALHDALTGLANRVLLLDRLEHALAQADRDERLVGVLYLDLDGFKLVNDRWGHAEGDLLLQAVAERLLAAVRPGDTLGRLGGDEFAVVCPGLASSRDLSAMAARIADALRQPYPLSTGRTHGEVGSSIGLAISGRGTTAEELLDSADFAMYSVKRQKRAAAGFEAAVDDVAGVPGFPGMPGAPGMAGLAGLGPGLAPEGVSRLVPPVG